MLASVRLSLLSRAGAPVTRTAAAAATAAHSACQRRGMSAGTPLAPTEVEHPPIVVTAGCSSWKLDRVLRLHVPNLGYNYMQSLLKNGQVSILRGDRTLRNLKASERVEAGDVVRFHSKLKILLPVEGTQSPISAADQALLKELVLFRDTDILIINKPLKLAMQEATPGPNLTVTHAWPGGTKTVRQLDDMLDLFRLDAEERPSLVHRLDRDTTGAMLLSRNQAAAAKLSKMIKTHSQVVKTYWAITAGVPTTREGTITVPIDKAVRYGQERMVVRRDLMEKSKFLYEVTKGGAKPTTTAYRVIDTFEKQAALVELQLMGGGQKHQLRVHCAEVLKAPILGDLKYGGAVPRSLESLVGYEVPMCLHSRAIGLEKWLPGETNLVVTASPPEHFLEAMKAFTFQHALGFKRLDKNH